MNMQFKTAMTLENGVVSMSPLKIYTGILGQVGDIVMFTATARRLRELFPNAQITFAVSNKYREAGELVSGLPYIDRIFVTKLYFERMTEDLFHPWHLGWPIDLRGEDEVIEQSRHDIVLETRARHRRMPWWKFDHQVAEMAHMVGVPGPIDLRTEIVIPRGTVIPSQAEGKIVIHNDPSIDETKAWPWKSLESLVGAVGADKVVLLGNAGPVMPKAIDLRGQTTLAQAAAIIDAATCFIGIDSGLMWIAASLEKPVIGLYGTSYIDAYEAIHPHNPGAIYLQTEGTLDGISADDVLKALQQLKLSHARLS